jgi:hypothetical protein
MVDFFTLKTGGLRVNYLRKFEVFFKKPSKSLPNKVLLFVSNSKQDHTPDSIYRINFLRIWQKRQSGKARPTDLHDVLPKKLN